LIQRGLFEEVKGTDGTAVHIETYTGSTPAARNTPAASEEGTPVLTQGWITVAASNVLPEVLLDIKSFVPVLRFIVTTQLYSQLSSHFLNNS
jgi:hypothetical protein